jgi:hypothetical protein
LIALCIQNGAQLIFTSLRSEAMMSRFRQLIDELCFDVSIDHRVADQLEADKPICITYNGSTLAESSSGPSSSSSASFTSSASSSVALDHCAVAIRNTFERAVNDGSAADSDQDPAMSVHFKEPQVDLVRAFMLTELEQFRQQHDLSRLS